MKVTLFHTDNEEYFDHSRLRRRACQLVRGLSLIQNAKSGDIRTAIAMKVGFWPFVREFETAIDQHAFPRQPLSRKFGQSRVRGIFAGTARAVREMKNDEGSHAAHWAADAECLGAAVLGDSRVPGVQALIDRSYTEDLPGFFAMLAGTELIAEELSAFLITSKEFTNLFSRKRWVWGEVHLAPHDGPSHLDLDLDLARAYSPTTSPDEIERMIVETIMLFGAAADEVEACFRSQPNRSSAGPQARAPRASRSLSGTTLKSVRRK